MGQVESVTTTPLKPPITYDAWCRIAEAMFDLEVKGGMLHEGIYRVPGLSTAFKKGMEYLVTGRGKDELVGLYKDEWASAIKSALWHFAPITGYAMYDVMVAAASRDVETLHLALQVLPLHVNEKLNFILDRLAMIALHSDRNNMGTTNLARLWCGILVRPDEHPADDLGRELQMAARQYVFCSVLLEHRMQHMHEHPPPTDRATALYFPHSENALAPDTAVSPLAAAEALLSASSHVSGGDEGATVAPARSASSSNRSILEDHIRAVQKSIDMSHAPTTTIDIAALAAAMETVRMERMKPEPAPKSKGFLRRISIMGDGGKPPSTPPSPSNTAAAASHPSFSFVRRASMLFGGGKSATLPAPATTHIAPDFGILGNAPSRTGYSRSVTDTSDIGRNRVGGGRFDASFLAAALGDVHPPPAEPSHKESQGVGSDAGAPTGPVGGVTVDIRRPNASHSFDAVHADMAHDADMLAFEGVKMDDTTDYAPRTRRPTATFPGPKPPPPKTPKPKKSPE